ncbi:MAG TPA: hypothetical protein VF062_06675 [Candidatus Limnocylindrales bacterium]
MSLIPRGFAAIAIAAVFTGALTPPASAAQTAAPQLSIEPPNLRVGSSSAGTAGQIYASSSESVLTAFRVEIDASGLAGVAAITTQEPWPTCEASGASITCPHVFTDLGPVPRSLFAVKVKPLAGVEPGASGKWKVTVSAEGLAPVSAEATVEVAEAVDLAVPAPDRVEVSAAPGADVPRKLEISNVSERTVDGTVAVFTGDHGTIAGKQYSNCTFLDDHFTGCMFDEQLAPGTTYVTSEAVAFKLRPDNLAPSLEWVDVNWMTHTEFDELRRQRIAAGQPDRWTQPGAGDRLRLVPKPQTLAANTEIDVNPANNWFRIWIEVEGNNDADLSAIGGSGSAAAGQVTMVSFGLKNNGPATIDGDSVGGPIGSVDLALPPGSSLAEMPESCGARLLVGDELVGDPNRRNLAARHIRCDGNSTPFRASTEQVFQVKLRIDEFIAGAKGTVAVATSGCDTCWEDDNPANNTAEVVLNGPPPSTPPAALPTTGVQVGLVAGAGVLLAVIGVGAFVLGRRRRVDVGE